MRFSFTVEPRRRRVPGLRGYPWSGDFRSLFQPMPHKAIDLPPEVARRFVEDMPRRFLKATVLSYVRDVTQMIPVQDRMQLVDNADRQDARDRDRRRSGQSRA